MSMRDDQVCLKDMLGHAREAVELLGNMNREALGQNRLESMSVVYEREATLRKKTIAAIFGLSTTPTGIAIEEPVCQQAGKRWAKT